MPTLDEEEFPFPNKVVSQQYPLPMSCSPVAQYSRPCGTADSSLKKKRVRKSQIGKPSLVSSSSTLPTVPVQRELSSGSKLKLRAVSFNRKMESSIDRSSSRNSVKSSIRVQAPGSTGYTGTGVYAMSLPKF